MPESQNSQNEKATKPRKRKAEASSNKTSTPKKTKLVVETSSNNATTSATQKEKTVEEVYQKKTQLEHILLRPDTYVGSLESLKEKMWVYDPEKQRMVYRDITYVPGLYKIVDEILVNAADNKIRDPTMNTIKVSIDKEEGKISVYNNGKGIPVEVHKDENVWVPELIFGHLLTSSNYDDSDKKVTGGRNGYGAKLANIFSTEFIVETTDSSACKKYRQIFKNNMSVTEKPKLTSYSKKEEYTMITFKPDFEKFNMSQFDDDIISLLKKRVYDMVGCVKDVKVFLNNERLKIKNFKEYMQLYMERDEPQSIIYEYVNERWEIGALPSPEFQFQQISFVNGICTSKGGTHVNYIADQLADRILAAVKSKKKDANIKKIHVKNHMWIFVKCLIENPTFDSQTKENLTLKVTSFGSSCNPSDAFFNKLLKCSIVDHIVEDVNSKLNKELKKTDGKKSKKITGITKLDDANNAGGRNAKDCTLILTEGDSAKSLAVAGLSEVGRDYYGVFPLRGKLLNVREGTHSQIMNNAEIQHIKQILGLKQGKEYESISELRYGHLMIMTDQDHDGSHIKGLIINFMDHFFPSLLKIRGFLLEFITPIVKCTKGDAEMSFFTMPEYERWKETNPNAKSWKIKYYKGLGTSSSNEAKKYFKNLNRHMKPFRPIEESERELIDMAFNKKKSDDRKEWLRNYEPGTYMNHNVNEITITDFINKELILFSRADNERSIPSVLDGLKPGQRKVLYTCFKKNFKNEIKVSSLAGAVLEQAAYHHGDASLQGTIIAMAHDFVGSNNINILHGEGQFGTRAQGGKDAASARYISVTIPLLTRSIFHPQDDALLAYCNDDGQLVEPEWYLPIIPMILVNGSEGIGTGWSSYIPNYNPRDIVNNLKRLINGEELIPMHPWYRGFQGDIEQISNERYKVNGKIQQVDDVSVRITELPIRVWTQNYKEQLEQWISGTERVTSWIQEYKENHTTTTVDFTVKLSEKKLNDALEGGLEKKFKMSTVISTSNMVCFDGRGRIKKYNSPEEILKEFYDYRFEYYHKRKAHMTKILEAEVGRLRNRARFIEMKIKHSLEFEGLSRIAIIDLLESNKFERFVDDKDTKDVNDDEDNSYNDNGYDYLMKSPAWSFCMEETQKLTNKKAEKEKELKDHIKKSPQQMWVADLDNFLESWDEILRQKQYRTSEVQIRFSEIPPQSSQDGSLPNAESIDDKKEAKKRTRSKKKNAIDDYFAPVEVTEITDEANATQNNKGKRKSMDPVFDVEETEKTDKVMVDQISEEQEYVRTPKRGRRKKVTLNLDPEDKEILSLDEKVTGEVSATQNDKGKKKSVDPVFDVEETEETDKVMVDQISEEQEYVRTPKRGRRKKVTLNLDPEDKEILSLDEKVTGEVSATQNDKGKKKSVDPVFDVEETEETDKVMVDQISEEQEYVRTPKRGRRKKVTLNLDPEDKEIPSLDEKMTGEVSATQNDKGKKKSVDPVSDVEETEKTDKVMVDQISEEQEYVSTPKRGRRKKVTLNLDPEDKEILSLDEKMTGEVSAIQNDKGKRKSVDPVSDVEEIEKTDEVMVDQNSEQEHVRPPKRSSRKKVTLNLDPEDEEIPSLDEKAKNKASESTRGRGKRKAVESDPEFDSDSLEVLVEPKKRPRRAAKKVISYAE